MSNEVVTVAKVNRALAKVGKERLRRGKGYYYFYDGDAAAWYTSSVYVNRVDVMTVKQWVNERARLAAL